MTSSGPSTLTWNEDRLRSATGAAGIALWSWNIETDEIALDEGAYDLWGLPRNSRVTFRDLSERIHPVDVERVGRAFQETRTQTGAYEIDFCILDNGRPRWVSARGQAGDAGMVDLVMFAVFMDITTRKQAENAREMLVGEMSHRVKNLFAVASALTAIASRSASTSMEMAADLTLRLTALGHAHELVLPVPGMGKTARLDELLAILLAPYDDRAAQGSRIHLVIPNVQVGETAVTTLALIVHELATNSIKHGALAGAAGILNLTCTDYDEKIVLAWTERNGPTVRPPAEQGYGSSLIARSVSGQLGGVIVYEWPSEGMIATLTMDRHRLAN